jgi:hypothetical protein
MTASPPPGTGAPSPADIAATLAGLLAGYGLTRIYVAACPVIAVIPVTAGLTAWTNGRLLRITRDGRREAWPAADITAAAARLAALARPARPDIGGPRRPDPGRSVR